MEFFIEHQNLLGTFLRRGEPNLRSVAIQYAVAVGVPLAQATKATTTSLKLPTGAALSQKAIQCTPCCRYTDLRLKPCPRKGGEPDVSSQTRLLYELVRSHGTTIRDAAIHEQWRQTKKLSACQLLHVALEVIIDDEPHMHFDYDQFLSGCCRLLSEAELHYSRHSRFGSRRRYDLHALKGEYSTVVHNIISEAADMELRERPLANTMLAKVCKMLESHISTYGGQCKKKALDRSSGDLRAASELELLHKSTSEADAQGKGQSPPPEASATYRPLDPGDANASLYGSKTHPAIEKLREATQKEFEAWSLKQDVPESVLLEQLEGTLQKNYSRVGCTKKVALEIQADWSTSK
ncbi:hypothetical protein Slin15195_G074410 [Septoria linicola]|uniref:Uncharacterized protein n=1 Tax=Septoria linicola TaxID=215465 RepID=A0A9Q9EL89_9PEZI|nr:hypothetical protein Slin15195_G074410 [Septoria linicola]